MLFRSVNSARTLSRLTSFLLDYPEAFSGLYETCEGILSTSNHRIIASASVHSLCRPTSLAATPRLTSPFPSLLARDYYECRDLRLYLVSSATSSVNAVMTIPGDCGVEHFGHRCPLLVGFIGITICAYTTVIIGSPTSQGNLSA